MVMRLILLLKLGFDLMEVGIDEVTLRIGKQANKRSIQFVLQAFLALFGNYFLNVIIFTLFGFERNWSRYRLFFYNADNQEGPRSLSLESSSSLESLVSENEELENEHITLSQPVLRNVRSTSVLRSGGSGAFTSYVRKRGEPDGRTAVTDSGSISVKVLKSHTRV